MEVFLHFLKHKGAFLTVKVCEKSADRKRKLIFYLSVLGYNDTAVKLVYTVYRNSHILCVGTYDRYIMVVMSYRCGDSAF